MDRELFNRVYRTIQRDLDFLKWQLSIAESPQRRSYVLDCIQTVRDTISMLDRQRMPARRDDAFNPTAWGDDGG